MKVLTELFATLLNEDLNEELYMARQAGLGLVIYPTKVRPPILCLLFSVVAPSLTPTPVISTYVRSYWMFKGSPSEFI